MIRAGLGPPRPRRRRETVSPPAPAMPSAAAMSRASKPRLPRRSGTLDGTASGRTRERRCAGSAGAAEGPVDACRPGSRTGVDPSGSWRARGRATATGRVVGPARPVRAACRIVSTVGASGRVRGGVTLRWSGCSGTGCRSATRGAVTAGEGATTAGAGGGGGTGTVAGAGAGGASTGGGGCTGGGRKRSGSRYPCGSEIRRTPRCTYGTGCSVKPLEPTEPTASPSATVAPRPTARAPRCSSVTE
jgi:hypothetical protein